MRIFLFTCTCALDDIVVENDHEGEVILRMNGEENLSVF